MSSPTPFAAGTPVGEGTDAQGSRAGGAADSHSPAGRGHLGAAVVSAPVVESAPSGDSSEAFFTPREGTPEGIPSDAHAGGRGSPNGNHHGAAVAATSTPPQQVAFQQGSMMELLMGPTPAAAAPASQRPVLATPPPAQAATEQAVSRASPAATAATASPGSSSSAADALTASLDRMTLVSALPLEAASPAAAAAAATAPSTPAEASQKQRASPSPASAAVVTATATPVTPTAVDLLQAQLAGVKLSAPTTPAAAAAAAATKEENDQQAAASVVKNRVGLVYDEALAAHRGGPEHLECPERAIRMVSKFEEEGLSQACVPLAPREATAAELLRAHAAEHIARVESYYDTATSASDQAAAAGDAAPAPDAADAAAAAAGARRSVPAQPGGPIVGFNEETNTEDKDMYWTPGTARAAKLAAGCTTAATLAVVTGHVDCAFAVVRPPGHHAECTREMGFCFFNNTVVAARAALQVIETPPPPPAPAPPLLRRAATGRASRLWLFTNSPPVAAAPGQ